MAQVNDEPIEISIDMLDLDPDNPRLPESVSGGTQQSILEYIARTTSIEELMEAIGENGYFAAEPVLAYKPDGTKKRYRVIEGNRRLTAVKLLNQPSLLPRRTRLLEIAEAAKIIPTKIPVVEFDDREDVLVYLGYRHITGIKQWEPLAKARYLFQLSEQFHTKHKSHSAGELYREVARAIGSNSGFIRKTLDSFVLFREIEARGFYGIDDLDEATIDFSLLTTSLGYENFQNFLELSGHLALQGARGHYNRSRLEQLTRWLFERTSSGRSRVGDSRNIKKLNKILADKKALHSFEKGASIDAAYRLTVGVIDDFMQHLHTAHDALIQANGLRADVRLDDDAREVIGKISRQTAFLRKALDDD